MDPSERYLISSHSEVPDQDPDQDLEWGLDLVPEWARAPDLVWELALDPE